MDMRLELMGKINQTLKNLGNLEDQKKKQRKRKVYSSDQFEKNYEPEQDTADVIPDDDDIL
jgi:hypothetical protein